MSSPSPVAKAARLVLAWLLAITSGCGSVVGASPSATPSLKGQRHPLLGQPAPTLVGDSVNGKGSVELARWNGKVVLVDFWATWCEPCKKSFPTLEALRVKYAASGLEIAAISEDDEPKGVPEFGASYGVGFPLLWDSEKSIANRWHPPNMPSSFLIDRNGVVKYVHVAYSEGEESAIEAELKSLL